MADDNVQPTLEEIQAERARRQRSARLQAAAGGQPVTVEAIRAERARRANQPRPVNPVEDVARSFVSGLQRGVVGAVSMGADARDLVETGAQIGAERGGLSPEASRTLVDTVAPYVQRLVSPNAADAVQGRSAPSSAEANQRALDAEPAAVRNWTGHEPQTTSGEYARTLGEFAPAVTAPGRIMTRLGRAAVPAVASETAGQLTEGTPYELPARLATGLGAGLGTELAIARTAPAAVTMNRVRQELQDAGVSPAGIQNVGALMRAGAPEADVLAAISADVGDAIPFDRMPTLARQLNVNPAAEGADLERRFGPMTSGERTGNVDDRLMQNDFEGSTGRPRRTVDNFNNRRAPIIAENVRRIATRGLPAQSLEGAGGAAAADDLREVFAMVRDNRRALYESADEAAALAGPINHNTVGNDLVRRAESMVQRLRLRRDPAHERWLREFEALQDDIQNNRATWEDVHVVRTQLNEAWGAANPADRRIISAFKRELDNFRDAYAPPAYRAAIENADSYSSEMSQMFGRRARTELGPDGEFTGTNDIAGRRIEEILNTDIDSRTLARMLINENGIPSRVGTTLARRLRQINDDLIRTDGTAATAPAGQQQRLAGRMRIGNAQTRGSRGFAADEANPGRFGVEQPTRALQAVREMVLDELVLSRLTTRTNGQPIPAQVIATRLRNALSERGGREMMRQLFTEPEMRQLDDVLRYFERLQTPTGASVSRTPAGMQRMMSEFAQGAIRRILGPVDRYVTAGMAGRFADNWAAGVQESRATANARRITGPAQPVATQPPVDVTQPSSARPSAHSALSAYLATAPQLSDDEEPRRRLGEPR